MVVLHNLEVRGSARCVCQGHWGQFFWLVHLRCGDWRDLQTGVKGQNADALMLWFIVACGDAGAVSIEGVEGAGSVDRVDGFERVAVAVAIVVECVRPFADDGIDAKVGTC